MNKAQVFAELHKKRPFILANAWDAASARTFERAGFSAIGTTSAGIAAARGYRDGQFIPFDEMLSVIQEIVSAVDVPVSADVEAGYGESLEEVVDAIHQVVDLGVVGINIEDSTGDGLVDIATQVNKIRTIRTEFPDIWINARVDVFYLKPFGPEADLKESIRRAHAYLEAGADSIFIFGTNDKKTISTFVQEVKAPINLLAGAGMPSIEEMEDLGIARVSLGSGPMRATLGLLEEISKELLSTGTYKSMTEKAMSYPSMQELF